MSHDVGSKARPPLPTMAQRQQQQQPENSGAQPSIAATAVPVNVQQQQPPLMHPAPFFSGGPYLTIPPFPAPFFGGPFPPPPYAAVPPPYYAAAATNGHYTTSAETVTKKRKASDGSSKGAAKQKKKKKDTATSSTKSKAPAKRKASAAPSKSASKKKKSPVPASKRKAPPAASVPASSASTEEDAKKKAEEKQPVERPLSGDGWWRPKEVWIDGVLEPKKKDDEVVTKLNLMDYIGKNSRRDRIYLPRDDFSSTDEATQQRLTNYFVLPCAQAGFRVFSRGWEAKVGVGQMRFCCERGILNQSLKAIAAGLPQRKEDLCPFKFVVKWDPLQRRLYVNSGYGTVEHRGHDQLPPEQVNLEPRRKLRRRPLSERGLAAKRGQYPDVVVDDDLNWKPSAPVWIQVHRDPQTRAVKPLERVNLLDFLGPEPKETAPVYFSTVYNNTQPETRKQLYAAIVEACTASGFKIVSRGFKGNTMNFNCPRAELFKSTERGMAAVVDIPSMKNATKRARPVCESERCHFRFSIRFKPKFQRFALEPGDGFGVHTGHRREGDPKQNSWEVEAEDRVRAWQRGNAWERYLPFLRGACNAADYSLEADQILRQRLEDMIEELRNVARKQYEEEKEDEKAKGSDGSETKKRSGKSVDMI